MLADFSEYGIDPDALIPNNSHHREGVSVSVPLSDIGLCDFDQLDLETSIDPLRNIDSIHPLIDYSQYEEALTFVRRCLENVGDSE